MRHRLLRNYHRLIKQGHRQYITSSTTKKWVQKVRGTKGYDTSRRWSSNNDFKGLFARNSVVRQKMTRDFKIFGAFMIGCGVVYLYLNNRNKTLSTRTKALLESAREKKERRQTRDSIALYEQALNIMEDENAYLAQAKVSTEIAQAYREKGEIDKAEASYNKALEYLDKVDHWKTAHIENKLSLDAGAIWNELASLVTLDPDETEARYLRALSLTLTKSQMNNVNKHLPTNNVSGSDVSSSSSSSSSTVQDTLPSHSSSSSSSSSIPEALPPRANAIQAAGILYNLGCFYAETGKLESAESVLERSLVLIQLSGEYRDGHAKNIQLLLDQVRDALPTNH